MKDIELWLGKDYGNGTDKQSKEQYLQLIMQRVKRTQNVIQIGVDYRVDFNN